MMLLSWIPVPGTITPEPSPLVHVTEAARPSASSTETCVLAPSRLPRKRSPKPSSPSRAGDSGAGARRRQLPVAQRLALAEQPPARRPQRRALGRGDEDRREYLADVGLLGVERDALGGEPRGGRGEVAHARAAPALQRLGEPGRD